MQHQAGDSMPKLVRRVLSVSRLRHDSVLLGAADGHRHGDGSGNRRLRRTAQTVTESMLSRLQRGRSHMLVVYSQMDCIH